MAEFSDEGLVIKRGSWAIIWEDGYFGLVAPKKHKDNKVPEEGLLLTALIVRIEHDPEFRQEQIDWFKARTDARRRH